MAARDATGPVAGRSDNDSARWVERLKSAGPERDSAIAELHTLLLGAARFEIHRRRATLRSLRGGDEEDLAQQSADDALVAILGKLGDFRGDSRFTTWAYKFALYEAAAKVRRRAWQGREIPQQADMSQLFSDWRSGPAAHAEGADRLEILGEAIATDLTAHQREVLVALALNDVPIDVLAERLRSTRGALYKTLHDARKKLRASLSKQGVGIDGDDA